MPANKRMTKDELEHQERMAALRSFTPIFLKLQDPFSDSPYRIQMLADEKAVSEKIAGSNIICVGEKREEKGYPCKVFNEKRKASVVFYVNEHIYKYIEEIVKEAEITEAINKFNVDLATLENLKINDLQICETAILEASSYYQSLNLKVSEYKEMLSKTHAIMWERNEKKLLALQAKAQQLLACLNEYYAQEDESQKQIAAQKKASLLKAEFKQIQENFFDAKDFESANAHIQQFELSLKQLELYLEKIKKAEPQVKAELSDTQKEAEALLGAMHTGQEIIIQFQEFLEQAKMESDIIKQQEFVSRMDVPNIQNEKVKGRVQTILGALTAEAVEKEAIRNAAQKEREAWDVLGEAGKHLADCQSVFDSLQDRFDDPYANKEKLSEDLSAYVAARIDEIRLAEKGDKVYGAIESKLSILKQKAERLKRTFARYVFIPRPASGELKLLENVIYFSMKDGCVFCEGLDPDKRPYEEKIPPDSDKPVNDRLSVVAFQSYALNYLAKQGKVVYSEPKDLSNTPANLKERVISVIDAKLKKAEAILEEESAKLKRMETEFKRENDGDVAKLAEMKVQQAAVDETITKIDKEKELLSKKEALLKTKKAELVSIEENIRKSDGAIGEVNRQDTLLRDRLERLQNVKLEIKRSISEFVDSTPPPSRFARIFGLSANQSLAKSLNKIKADIDKDPKMTLAEIQRRFNAAIVAYILRTSENPLVINKLKKIKEGVDKKALEDLKDSNGYKITPIEIQNRYDSAIIEELNKDKSGVLFGESKAVKEFYNRFTQEYTNFFQLEIHFDKFFEDVQGRMNGLVGERKGLEVSSNSLKKEISNTSKKITQREKTIADLGPRDQALTEFNRLEEEIRDLGLKCREAKTQRESDVEAQRKVVEAAKKVVEVAREERRASEVAVSCELDKYQAVLNAANRDYHGRPKANGESSSSDSLNFQHRSLSAGQFVFDGDLGNAPVGQKRTVSMILSPSNNSIKMTRSSSVGSEQSLASMKSAQSIPAAYLDSGTDSEADSDTELETENVPFSLTTKKVNSHGMFSLSEPNISTKPDLQRKELEKSLNVQSTSPTSANSFFSSDSTLKEQKKTEKTTSIFRIFSSPNPKPRQDESMDESMLDALSSRFGYYEK